MATSTRPKRVTNKPCNAKYTINKQRAAQQKHAQRLERLVRQEGNIERGDVGHAVEAAQQRIADVIGRAGGGIDAVVENKRERQRDDTDIDVADAGIKHEITERGREHGRQQHRQQQRARAFADVDDGNGIGVGAEPEERRMAETEDTAIAPDERQAQRQDTEDRIKRDLQKPEKIEDRSAARSAAPSRARRRRQAPVRPHAGIIGCPANSGR